MEKEIIFYEIECNDLSQYKFMELWIKLGIHSNYVARLRNERLIHTYAPISDKYTQWSDVPFLNIKFCDFLKTENLSGKYTSVCVAIEEDRLRKTTETESEYWPWQNRRAIGIRADTLELKIKEIMTN